MHSLKVLILEDHPFQLMALHQMLNANGVFDVLAAESADCAMQMLARRGPVDVAICDLHLDGSDALELIRHLAQDNLASALIVLSDAEPALLDSVGALARQLGLKLLGTVQKPASVALLHRLLSDYHETPGEPALAPGEPRILELACLSPEQLARSREQWRVHYQPRVSATGGLAGVEATVRWQHSTLGLLAPGQFYTVLKGAGLADLLVWHVLEQALAFSAAARLESPLAVAVKIPSSLPLDAGFVARLTDLLARQRLPASVLTLELEERHCRQLAEAQWQMLAELGCRLSLGGFGSGAFALPQLFELPLSQLTLPVDAIRGMSDDGRKAGTVANAMILARRLKLSVVVEGVDSLADWQVMHGLGRPVAQGRFIAGPMSGDDLLKWISAHQPAALIRKGVG